MILRELKEGQRFEFSDQHTPVRLSLGIYSIVQGRMTTSYPSMGSYLFLRNGVGTCPVILHEGTGVELHAVSGTYERSVVPIL